MPAASVLTQVKVEQQQRVAALDWMQVQRSVSAPRLGACAPYTYTPYTACAYPGMVPGPVYTMRTVTRSRGGSHFTDVTNGH